MVVGGATLLPEILPQPAAVGAKSPILNRYSLSRLPDYRDSFIRL